MRELKNIEVKIEPYYYASPGSINLQLRIDVRFNGKEYHVTEALWNSDAISVLDYCFDRAKRTINNMINREEISHEPTQLRHS
jgi:hypothetical protein